MPEGNSNNIKMAGNSGSHYQGTVYAQDANVELSGNRGFISSLDPSTPSHPGAVYGSGL